MLKKLFLSFICLFLFFSFNEAKAQSSTTENGLIKGFSKMKDRVRKFNQFDYKYNEEQGFSCKPQSVRGTIAVIRDPEGMQNLPSSEIETLSTEEQTSNKLITQYTGNDSADKTGGAGTATLAILAEVIDIALTPVICKFVLMAFLSGFKTRKPGDKGYVDPNAEGNKESDNDYFSGGTMIGAMIAFTILDLLQKLLGQLINEFIGGNDYALDLTNPYCTPMSATLLGTCIGFMIVSSIYNIVSKESAFAYLGTVLIYLVAKGLFVAPQEVRAIKSFERMSICGDEWYTYGNPDLLKTENGKDDYLVNTQGNYELKEITGVASTNLTKTSLDYYPIKTDALPGSYKFHLYKCIREKNFKYCEKLCNYNRDNLNDTHIALCQKIQKDIVNKRNYNQENLYANDKFYREWLYGGMEIKFDTLDYNQAIKDSYADCVDPRESVENYDTYANDTKINIANSYNSPRRQLYYASGTDGVNFACDRWQKDARYEKAYNCCVRASQRFICINYRNSLSSKNELKNQNTFCEVDYSVDNKGRADCRIKGDLDIVYAPMLQSISNGIEVIGNVIIDVVSLIGDSIQTREIKTSIEHAPAGKCNLKSFSSNEAYNKSSNTEYNTSTTNNFAGYTCDHEGSIELTEHNNYAVAGNLLCDDYKDTWYDTVSFFTNFNTNSFSLYSRINKFEHILTWAFQSSNISLAKNFHIKAVNNSGLLNLIKDDIIVNNDEICGPKAWEKEEPETPATGLCQKYINADNDLTKIQEAKIIDLIETCPDTISDIGGSTAEQSKNNCYCFSKYKELDKDNNLGVDKNLLTNKKKWLTKDKNRDKTKIADTAIIKEKDGADIDDTSVIAQLQMLSRNDYECSNKFSTCTKELENANIESTLVKASGLDIADIKDGVSIPLKIYFSNTQGDTMYCAHTWSMCPYDFNIMGGTEIAGDAFNQQIKKKNGEIIAGTKDDYGDEVTSGNACITQNVGGENKGSDGETNEVKSCYGKASNYCQLYRHCAYLRPHNIGEAYSVPSPYLDKSCINGVGNSKYANAFEKYVSYEAMRSIKFNLAAPIVECFTETLRNMLLNKAGHTRCKIASEKPTVSLDNNNQPIEYCRSGIEFSIYEYLDNTRYENKLHSLIRKFQTLVKALLTLSIMMFGFKVVVMGDEVKQEKLVKLMFKLIFVVSFALGTWWVQPIISAIFQTTNSVIGATFNYLLIPDIMPSYNNPKFDGCYFASDISITDATTIAQKIPTPVFYEYPKGREYLAVFDMVDCKLKRYLGITENAGVAIMIIAILIIFTGGILIIILFPLIFILVTTIINVLKIMYLFIMALMILSLLLFFAPIMIPLVLFDKTKGIFDSWLKEVIGFIFFPMFLVCAVVIMFYIFDIFYVGDAFFVGINNGPNRTMYCGNYCKFQTSEGENEILLMSSTGRSDCENILKGEFYTLKNTNLMCLLNSPIDSKPVQNNFIQFFVKNLNFTMLNPKVINSTWKLIFSNGLILLLILLFLDKILDGIVQLGQAIFEVSVNAGDFPSVKDIMGKIMGYAGKNLLSNPAMNGLKMGAYAAADKIQEKKNRVEAPKDKGDSSDSKDSSLTFNSDAKPQAGGSKNDDKSSDAEPQAGGSKNDDKSSDAEPQAGGSKNADKSSDDSSKASVTFGD